MKTAVYISDDDYAKCCYLAEQQGQTYSAWMRRLAYAEMSRKGLLKHSDRPDITYGDKSVSSGWK